MWTLSHIHYDVGDGVRKSMPMRWAYTRRYGVTWAALQRYVMALWSTVVCVVRCVHVIWLMRTVEGCLTLTLTVPTLFNDESCLCC